MKTYFNLFKSILFAAFLLLAAGSQAQTVTYLWSNGATTPNIVVNPQETTTYYLTITQDGVEYFDSLVVTVTPPPLVAINGNSSVCLGFSTTLQATQGNSYLWSTGDTTASITVSPSVNTTYSVEITDANGCTGTAEINVVVSEPAVFFDVQQSCGPFTWIDGVTYTSSTNTPTFTIPGGSVAGCDSIITLDLTINNSVSATDVQSACGSFTWIDGVTYTSSTNTPTFTIPGVTIYGCDSVVTLNLTITPQPEQPQLACWQTATFDAASCSWIISGTQPTEPTDLACWETATFNTALCAWEVSGTQPEQPTNLACYETALFVDTLCSWVVTGTPSPAIVTNASACISYTWEANGTTYNTSGQYSFNSNCQEFVLNLTIDGQPEQPQLSCWQTATFDAASCSWIISGTQPAQPTDLACWETATFNANACAWVVSGTQPAQPTDLACYETAAFVDTLCAWVVSGTPAPAIVTNASACVSYTWEANGTIYNTSGQYSFNSNCQEFVLNLTINQESASTINATITEGEIYSLNGQNLTTAGAYTATLQNVAGCDSVVTLNLTVIPDPVGGCYASSVVSFVQGSRRDGTPVTAVRSDPNQALGMPEPVVNNVVNFVSLGFGGSLTLAFETPIANGPGADIRIDEATNNYPESADVFASQDGVNFVYLGTACHDAEFDLAALSWAQYIRIVDASNPLSFTADADGFDVNGVSCLNGAATAFENDGLVACSLQEIIAYQPGNRKNGSAIPPARRNSNNALGMPQNNNTINFVALGFGGSLVAKFDFVVFNQDGNDIRVVETSYGNPSCNNNPERALVSVSMDNVSWTELGEICQDGEFDLGAVPYAQFIKIEDVSPVGSNKFKGSADGFDVDAVVVMNNGCGMNTARVAGLDNTKTPDSDMSMRAYPNPIEDYIIIRFEGLEKEETFKLEIFDASSRLVRSENIIVSVSDSEYFLPAQELARGIYRMVVSNETGCFSEQLVK